MCREKKTEGNLLIHNQNGHGLQACQGLSQQTGTAESPTREQLPTCLGLFIWNIGKKREEGLEEIGRT